MGLSELAFSIGHRTCHPSKTDIRLMSVDPKTDPCVARLIDANLDRAKEGLRVLEDWCRFGIERKDLVIRLKDWRQELGRHHLQIYKDVRSTNKDAGLGLTHSNQKRRKSPYDVIQANSSRVQEALRVLEEFARAINPELTDTASRIRYGVYEIEVTIINSTKGGTRRKKLIKSNLCVITSEQDNLYEIAFECIKGGAPMIQYRCKNLKDSNRVEEGIKLSNLCKENDSLFIVNDRVDIAIAVNADGVHLGQTDMPIDFARKLLGNDKLIGSSAHSIEEVSEAEIKGFDYLGIGPIYSSDTKPDLVPIGINLLEEASKTTSIPIFAIGGINISNINRIASEGITRVALSASIMNSENPFQATKEILEVLK